MEFFCAEKDKVCGEAHVIGADKSRQQRQGKELRESLRVVQMVQSQAMVVANRKF